MKTASLIFLCLWAGMPFAATSAEPPSQPEVKISQQRVGDVIQILAENVSDHALTVTVQLSNIINAKSDGWPTKAVKRCLAGDSILMTALIQDEGAPAATFTCTMTTSTEPPPSPQVALQQAPAQQPQTSLPRPPLGSAPAAPAAPPAGTGTENKGPEPVDPHFPYLLPYQHGMRFQVSQGYKGRESHAGLYALDFEMPVGTPVCAAREGIVLELQKNRQDADTDGTIGNYVAIKHSDNTVALYAQLGLNCVSVAVGEHVIAGQIVGYSGTTGHSNGPHIHFEVDALKEAVGVTEKGVRGSIPVVFNVYGEKGVTPVVGTFYAAE